MLVPVLQQEMLERFLTDSQSLGEFPSCRRRFSGDFGRISGACAIPRLGDFCRPRRIFFLAILAGNFRDNLRHFRRLCEFPSCRWRFSSDFTGVEAWPTCCRSRKSKRAHCTSVPPKKVSPPGSRVASRNYPPSLSFDWKRLKLSASLAREGAVHLPPSVAVFSTLTGPDRSSNWEKASGLGELPHLPCFTFCTGSSNQLHQCKLGQLKA